MVLSIEGAVSVDLSVYLSFLNEKTELKELIAMHSTHATHGGDLKHDTVNIIGATLDLQEKVVQQVSCTDNLYGLVAN